MILWGDGKNVYGTYKNISVTIPTPYENLYASPNSIPNVSSIPVTQIDSYTVASTDQPSFNPNVFSFRNSGQLILAGKNTDTATRSINVQINVNGVSKVSTTFNTNAGQYWTWYCYNLLDIKVGDIVTIYLWCSSSTLINYDYMAFTIFPASIQVSESQIVNNLSITSPSTVYPVLTKGNPNWASTQGFNLYPTTDNNYNPYSMASAATYTFPYMQSNLLKLGFGDSNSTGTQIQNNATYRPLVQRLKIPSQISFRKMLR